MSANGRDDHDTESSELAPEDRDTQPPEELSLPELARLLERQLVNSNDLSMKASVAAARCSDLCVELITRLQRDEVNHHKLASRVTYLEQLAGVESVPP